MLVIADVVAILEQDEWPLSLTVRKLELACGFSEFEKWKAQVYADAVLLWPVNHMLHHYSL